MARGKRNARQQAEEQARARRNSAAHRALRRRAQKGVGARSLDAPTSAEEELSTASADEAGADAPTEIVTAESSAPDVGAAEAPTEADDSTEPEDETQAESADDERTSTSELPAPAWLAAGATATAQAEGDVYVPREVLPTEYSDEVDGEDATGGETPEEPTPELDSDEDDEEAVEEEQEAAASAAPTRASVFAPPAESRSGAGEPDEPDADDDATAVHEPVHDTAVLSPVEQREETAPESTTNASAGVGAASAPWASADDDSSESHRTPERSSDADDDGHDTSRPKRRAVWAVPLTLAVLAVLYLGAQALLSNTVPRGTQVLGQEIGGMSAAEATGVLADAADAIEDEEVELRVAEQTFALPAADAGLSIDAERTVGEVTGFTVMPDRLWAHLAGGPDVTPVIGVDEQTLEDAVETASVQLDGPAQDAGVTVADGAVEVVPGRSAITVDQEASVQRIAQAWPATQSIELVAETTPPAITDEDAASFASALENETFAAPVTLVGEEAEATVEPATIAATSTVEPGPRGLTLVVDGQALAERIIEDNPDLTTSGENASVSFDDNEQIVINEGKPGITIDGEALGDAIIDAAGSADRTGELPYTAADPEVSAEDLGLADFKEIISSFDTPLTAERIRTQNLRTAADDVEGVIVHPGETFDLTEVLSPINEEEGYQPAHVIVNGILTNGMGGGLSQMATTTYNAGYFAGYEILDHRPHSVWFTRYPAGRESTIYTGSINVEFRNNTPYSAVFNSYVSGGRLHVDVWSTKHFEVTTSASPKTNIREPGVKEVTASNCEAKSAGQPGFTITNTRTVYLEGEEVDRSSDTWTYKPDDAIRCVSEDEDEDEDDA